MTTNNPQQAFYSLLIKCLDNNNEERKNAEMQITKISETNYEDVLLNCSFFLMNDSLPKEVRQLCGVIIKNSLAGDTSEAKWLMIQQQKRTTIKENVLTCLGSETKEIRRGAATSVSAIAKIELPRGEWPTLVNTLVNASQHSNINYKISSILTAGFISQEIEPSVFPKEERDKVFNMIFMNLPFGTITNLELILQTLNALLKFIPFLSPNMTDNIFRFELYKHLFSYTLQHPNDEVKNIALQCVTELSKLYYDYIEQEIPQISQFISTIMKGNDEKLGAQGYVFWISLSEEEINRVEKNRPMKYYCQSQYKNIWSDIMYQFNNRNPQFERDNEEDFTRYIAASYLLDNLSKLLEVSFINDIFLFITECLKTNNPEKQTIAFYAFSSILETKWVDEIRKGLNDCITKLVSLLTTQYPDLQLMISWCIDKISEFHAETFVNNHILLDSVLNGIKNTIFNFSQKVAEHFIFAIHHLSTELKIYNQAEVSLFTPYLKDLLNMLIKLAYSKNSYNPNYNISSACFLAIGTLIENSEPNDIITLQNFFAMVYDALQSSLMKENFTTEKMMYAFQEYLCSVIIAYSSSRKYKMTIEQGKSVYLLIKQTFIQRNDVYEDGLVACSSLVMIMQEGDDFIVKDYMNYLVFALKKYQETAICLKALLSISDLINCMTISFVPYLEQLFPLIMSIINSPEAAKEIKVQILLIFSDMYGNLPSSEIAWNSYQSIMGYLMKAMEVAVITPDINDPDLCEYYSLLKERIVECLGCIIRYVLEINKVEIFHPYLEKVMGFISFLNTEKENPSLYIISGSAGVITDLCDMYKKDMALLINDETIKYMTKRLLEEGGSDNTSVVYHLQQKTLMIKIIINI